MYKIAYLLSLIFFSTIAKHEQYIGHVVYEVTVANGEQAKQVSMLEDQLGLDIWCHATPSRPGQVLVPGAMRQHFESEMAAAGIDYKLRVENVKEMLDKEDRMLAAAANRRNKTEGRLSYDTIHRYDVVDAYLVQLANQYSTVSVVSGGKSFEGRDIKYLRISTTNFQDTSKPIIMLQSMIHAREWITLPAALYAIEKLIVDITDRELVDEIDWIILPIANPDGYEFTHTSNRIWRKNRSTGHMVGNVCLGVDLNRNFDINWGIHSSNFACFDTFHGSGPFSEPETQVIRDIIREYRNRLELYVDIHSFGSMILYAYGNGQLPANALALNVVGVRMAQAIDAVKWASKPNFIVGNIAMTLLYFASGGASDYVQAVGVPLSYTYELPAYRNNQDMSGFLVQPEFIEQAGYETWEGIKAGAKFVLDYTRVKRLLR